jgi:hypothetical protein
LNSTEIKLEPEDSSHSRAFLAVRQFIEPARRWLRW